MTLSELINEILSEWAYRVDDGMPNPKNPIHLKELSVVLSEMGLSHIKSTLIENITEAEEGSFKNPVLNKKVKYKNTKGEDAEGIVGNMLRLPKEHPGRKAAEAMIPKDGTPERDALNKDLGGEGQPAKPEDEKGKEGGEDKGGEEDKAAAAQAMFDPKADPAMGARLDREKAANDKLAADAEKDKEAEKPKEEPTPGSPEDFKNKADKVAKQKEEAKKKGYNDSLHAMSDNQLDSAINDAQKKMHDAQKSGDDKAADKANTEYAQHKVEQEMRKVSKGGDKEIADAAVGNFLARKKDYEEKYGEPYEADIPYPDSDGGERTSAKWGGEEPTGPEAGPNEEPPANEPSKPDTTPPVDAEKPKTSKKIKVRKPIQSAGEEEPTGASTQYPEKFHMGGAYYSSNEDGSPEFKSIEGKLIPLSDTEKEFIKVNKLDPAVLGRLDKLAADGGTDIEAAIKNTDYEKSLKDKLVKYYKDKPKTKPKEAPSEPAKREPANDDPESKAQQFKGNKSGENIQTMEMEGGGFVYGTKHGNTAMVDDILDDVKSKIPKERWGDIVFVGEGGATGESGEVEFNEEMDYAAPKFKELGAGVDTWDGDDLDVHKPDSKLYKKQIEKTGLSQSQVNAGNWASMIGQGEGTDTMKTKTFLNDEGKGFLQDAAKEAGFPPIENWDEPTEQDKDTLYRLSFPKDNGDKPTKINDIQVAFNDIRDENLIEKNKELTAQGKIPITIAGEGHVDLVDKMSRKGEQPSTTEPAEPSAEPETPSAKKPDIVIPGEKPGTVVRKSDGKPDVVVPGKKASDEKPKDAEKPEDKKDDEDIKKEKPGQQATSSSGKKLYSVGGGYYSDKPNGAAKYVRTESIVELMFDDVLNEDIFALFEKTISATLSNGKKITVQELPPRAQKKATQKARKAAAAYKEPDAKPPVIAPPGVKPKAPTDAAPPIGTKAGAVPPPPPPPPPTAKKADEPKADNKFNPIPPQDVQSEIPQADPDTFGAASDIPDGIEKQDLEKFNTDISKVQKIVADAKAKGEKAPNINLCDVTVPGTNLYCDDNLGIPRDQMPQFKGKPVPGSKAEKMPLNKDGEVDTEPVFREMLKEKGIKTTQTEVAADKLKATQSELGGDKVIGMMGALEKDPNNPGITGPVYVSRDGFVIDGHHRWAAIAAYNAKYPDKQIPMKCEVIDMDIKDAIPMCNKFAEEIGIAAKKQGETTGKAGEEQPKEQPKKVSSFTKVTDKIKEKISKWQSDEKEFFEKGYYKAGSEPRRSISQAIKDKAKGAWKAIKKGAKHEVEEFKAAGIGVKNFFSGKEVSEHEVKALKSVGIKIITTALFGAALGGLSYGAAGFAKHVAIEFIPHVVGETILKGAGRAALFADVKGEAELDANMEKFIEMISKGLEEMDINEEQMEAMVDSYNEKKEKGEINNKQNTGMKEENLQLTNELIIQIISEIKLEENPIKKGMDVLDQTVKNPETGKDIKVSSALKYKGSKNKGQVQAYQSAITLLKKSGVSDKELGSKQQKPKEIPGQSLGFRKTKEKELEPQPKKSSTKISSFKDAFFTNSKQKDESKKAAIIAKKIEASNSQLDKISKLSDKKGMIKLETAPGSGKFDYIPLKTAQLAVKKLLSGEQLGSDDVKILNKTTKIVTNPENGSNKLYFAKKYVGKHPQQGYESVEISSDNSAMGDSIRSFALSKKLNVGKSSEGAIGKKVFTPLKMSSAINPSKPESMVEIKKTPNGVNIGGKEMKRLKELDEKQLTQILIKKGINPEEAKKKANILYLQTKAYNQKLDDLARIGDASGGKIPMANFGDVTNPQFRKKTASTILDGITKRFETELDNFGKTFGKDNLKGSAENKKVFDTLSKLKSLNAKASLENDEKARTEYKEALDQLLLDMANAPDFKDSVADFAEMKAGLQFLAEGKQVYFPASENFQTADIIVMPDEFSVKPKKGQTIEESIAENLQFYGVTVTYVGGLSVKYKGGGGSANYSKITQTEYKNPKTKDVLLGMQDVYSLAYPKDKSNQLNIKDSDIKLADKKVNEGIDYAIKSGIITKQEAELIKKIGQGQAVNTLKGGLKDIARCKGANRANFEKATILHHTMMHLTAVINNRDVAYTRFSNFNEEVSQNKDGIATKITDDIADGVNKPCYMNPHHNPGFSVAQDEKTGCITGAPTNQNPSHIESEPPKNLLKSK